MPTIRQVEDALIAAIKALPGNPTAESWPGAIDVEKLARFIQKAPVYVVYEGAVPPQQPTFKTRDKALKFTLTVSASSVRGATDSAKGVYDLLDALRSGLANQTILTDTEPLKFVDETMRYSDDQVVIFTQNWLIVIGR